MEHSWGKENKDVLTLTRMLEAIRDLVFLMEADGDSFRYVYLNESAEKVLDHKTSVLGKRLEDVVFSENAAILIPKYRHVHLSLEPIEFLEKLETSNGVFVGETSLSPIVDENGQCRYIVAIVRDVTDRLRREEELKETKRKLEREQKRLNSLIVHNDDAIFEFDLEGNFVSINERASELTGYARNEFIGRSFIPLLVEEYIEDTVAYFKSAVNGKFGQYETAIYHKDGHQMQLFVKNVPIIIDGVLEGIYGIARDVTRENELKQAERELQKSLEKFKLITENAFDIIKIISISGGLDYVSPSGKKILGYEEAEMLGAPVAGFIHPEDMPLIEERINEVLSKNQHLTAEIRVKHRDGYYLWMEAVITPIEEEGEVRQIVTIARDITERKRLRDEMEKIASVDHLSGLPNRRTFEKQLNTAIHQADRTRKKVGVLLLDGRNFKMINDTYGHDAGDAVIKEMAKRVLQCIRETDTAARFGGDELAVILPGIEREEEAERVAKRIIKAFGRSSLPFEGNEVDFGAEIGIAIYPDHTHDEKQLIRLADKALYEAKNSTESAYQIYRN